MGFQGSELEKRWLGREICVDPDVGVGMTLILGSGCVRVVRYTRVVEGKREIDKRGTSELNKKGHTPGGISHSLNTNT